MQKFRQFLRDEFHQFVLFPAYYVPLAALLLWCESHLESRWTIAPWQRVVQFLVVFIGGALWSQSWHENQHGDDPVEPGERPHPTHFAGVHWRVISCVIGIAGVRMPYVILFPLGT